MNKKRIVAVLAGVLGIILVAKIARGGQCYTVDNIGTSPNEPYYYATYLGETMAIVDAFWDARYDMFTVEFIIDGVYQPVPNWETILHGQEFRFQVVRTTEICHINLVPR